jgi:hypothetical protein
MSGVIAPTINPATGPKTYPEQIIKKVQGWKLGIAAKGILRTAENVANMETRAISLEPRAIDSNLKKKANITKMASRIAIKPQLTRAFNEGNKAKETAKPMPMIDTSPRKI